MIRFRLSPFIKSALVILLLVTFISCSSNESQSINGKWLLHAVVQSGENVTEEHDPFDERFLTINEDGTFASGGRPFGENTGKYELNQEDMTLFFDSDLGEEDDSNWIVTLNGDTMHWQGYGTAWAEDFELIHVRE